MASERTNVSNLTVAVAGAIKALRTQLLAAIATAKAEAKSEVKADLLGTATSAMDTLGEIQAAITADETAAAGMADAIGKRVRFDAPQTLTSGEKTQARANIDALSSSDLGAEVDYVALFNTTLNS